MSAPDTQAGELVLLTTNCKENFSGSGSGSGSGSTITGFVVDGYMSSIVNCIDLITEDVVATTTSDHTGKYTLPIPNNKVYRIEATEATDTFIGKTYNSTFSAYVTPASMTSINITPHTTTVSALISKRMNTNTMNKSLDDIITECNNSIATGLNMSVADLHSDFLQTNKTDVFLAATNMNLIVETLSHIFNVSGDKIFNAISIIIDENNGGEPIDFTNPNIAEKNKTEMSINFLLPSFIIFFTSDYWCFT